MITEFAERRVLGALRFVSSVNQLPIAGAMDVRVLEVSGIQPPPLPARPPIRVISNGQGLGVIHAAPGLEDFVGRFEPVATPVRTLRLRAVDRSGAYLPAEFSVALPRSLNATRLPNGHFNTDSTFEPITVAMMPSPRAAESANWAILRVHLRHEIEIPPPPAPPSGVFQTVASYGALIRIHAEEPAPRRLLGRGLAEWRALPRVGRATVAEALVAVPDIPVTQWSNLPNANVLTPNQSVRVEARVDLNFNAEVADTIPDLNRLEPPGIGALPNRVLAAELPAARPLRTGLRETLRLFLNRNGQLAVE